MKFADIFRSMDHRELPWCSEVAFSTFHCGHPLFPFVNDTWLIVHLIILVYVNLWTVLGNTAADAFFSRIKNRAVGIFMYSFTYLSSKITWKRKVLFFFSFTKKKCCLNIAKVCLKKKSNSTHICKCDVHRFSQSVNPREPEMTELPTEC